MQITGFLDARIFIAQLEAMPKNIRKEVRRDIRHAAENTADKAREYSPVRTGAMKASIIVRKPSYSPGGIRATNDLMMEVHVGAFYSGFVDAGANQPRKNVAWFRRAVRDTRVQNNEIVKNAIRKGLQSTVNSTGLTINGKNLGFLDAVTLA